MDLINIYQMFYPTPKHTHSTQSAWKLSKIGHILGHKMNLLEFKKIDITP